MLKYKADLRSILYLIIISAMLVWQWQNGLTLSWTSVIVYIVFIHFAVAISVITHNHNHLNMWENKALNVLTDWWLTVFYGIPIFCWIPTHNRNHHKFNNKVGDNTATYRHSEDNHLFTLVSYPSKSSYYQIVEGIIPYMKKLKVEDSKTYWEYMIQIVVLVVWNAAWLIVDWKKALVFIIIPQQISGYMVMIFNYVQHVHADELSKWNHSRNFMGVNLFLFNNGYHTAHHEKANMHWSESPKYHEQIKENINPILIEKSFWGYIFRAYIFGAFNKKFKTNSMRLQRIQEKGV